MFGLSNFIITEFLLIFYSLVTNVLYSYIHEKREDNIPSFLDHIIQVLILNRASYGHLTHLRQLLQIFVTNQQLLIFSFLPLLHHR